jgi:dephospho-CoA kinase
MSDNKMIIGLTGLPAAGKGTIGKYLMEKHKAKAIRFSDPLREIIKRLYIDPTRESMSHLATFLRGEFGNDVLIQTLLKDADKSKGHLFVLDGMRYPEEFEVLSKRSDFKMWGVITDFENRYNRILVRVENESDKSLTREQFKEQHQLKTELYIPELLKKVDETVNNNGSLEDLYKKVDGIIASYDITD